MKTFSQTRTCSRGEALLAYLYREMSPSERSGFEIHLADCSSCIDEFAELANSRFEVYEWRRLAFDPLETPDFVVPFNERAPQRTGLSEWLTSLREVFAFRPAFAVGGLAGIALMLVFGYLVVLNIGNSGMIADLNAGEPAGLISPVSETVVPVTQNEHSEITAGTEGNEATAEVPAPARPESASRPRINRRETDVRAIPARMSDSRALDELPARQTALRLNDFDDNDDDGLRLVDLFEDIETSD